MAKTPNLVPTLHWIQQVTSERRFDAIKADAVMAAAHKRNIFGVRPTKRHCRASWTTAFHSTIRQVSSVPQLFADHPTLVGKVFHCRDERLWIEPASVGELNHRRIGISVRIRRAGVARINADVVPRKTFD